MCVAVDAVAVLCGRVDGCEVLASCGVCRVGPGSAGPPIGDEWRVLWVIAVGGGFPTRVAIVVNAYWSFPCVVVVVGIIVGRCVGSTKWSERRWLEEGEGEEQRVEQG